MHRKATIAVFALFIVSVMAQITFVLLFQYHDSFLKATQSIDGSASLIGFFSFSKPYVDPLFKTYEFVMDIWVVLNMVLFSVGIVVAITD